MRIPKIFLTIVASALLPSLVHAGDLSNLIRNGSRDLALASIRSGADVNELEADGSSPLLWAVYRVDQEMVKELLQHGARPDVRNVLGTTALCEAVSISDVQMVEMLLKARADPNIGNDDDQTPLMLAARNGSLPIAQALVKAGARVNQREKYRNQSALMWAIGANSPEVTELLIRHKADVETRAASTDWGNQITSEPRAQYRPPGGLTPLLYATRSGCLDCVKSLLKAGADVNRPTPEAVTPLMNAIDNSQFAIANYLLDQGANPHLFDQWGRTAIYLTADMRTRGGAGPRGLAPGVRATDGANAPAPQFSALQLMQRLVDMGVNLNPQLEAHRPYRGRFTDDLLNTGCTPLLRAAISVDREAIAILLKGGALPDLPNVMGVTPLMAASAVGASRGLQQGGMGPIANGDPQTNAIAVIGMLIKAGADVNARISDTSSHTALIARPSSMTNRQGQTAIYGAISENWVRVARYLIENGARLDIKDDAGKTVIDALSAANAGGRENLAGEEMAKLIKGAVGAT